MQMLLYEKNLHPVAPFGKWGRGNILMDVSLCGLRRLFVLVKAFSKVIGRGIIFIFFLKSLWYSSRDGSEEGNQQELSIFHFMVSCLCTVNQREWIMLVKTISNIYK